MNRDHIGYPMATIAYTGTIQWQPDPEPWGDVYAEQSIGSGHDPLIRCPGQWRVDPVLDTDSCLSATQGPRPDRSAQS